MHRVTLPATAAAIFFATTLSVSAQSSGIASLSPGIITLYAGGANGCSGTVTPAPATPYDGCPPANIKLGGVRTVAFDASGNLYIADLNDHRIRKITPAGVVSTLAGTGGSTGITYASTGAQIGDNGPATGALVIDPTGLAVDSGGSVYFTDYITNRVRVIYEGPGGDAAAGLIALENPGMTAQRGYIYTIAGTGQPGPSGDGGMASAATFANTANITSSNSTNGVAVDTAGDVYIADTTNDTLREVNAKSGIITTIAGTAGTSGSTGDGGLATSALFNLPRGIAVDTAGNIYVADSSNSKVRMINGPNTIATKAGLGHGFGPGVVHTIAGGGTGSASAGPYGNLGTSAKIANAVRNVSVDAGGNVYIGDAANYRVERLDPNDILTLSAGNSAVSSGFTAITTLATVTGLGGSSYGISMGQPYDGAVNPVSGDLIVADNTTGALYDVSASSSLLAFGSQPTYVSSSAQTVTLVNTGAGLLHLSSVSISGASFSITTSGRTDCTGSTVLQPGQSCQVAVLFTPTAASTLTGTLTLADDSLGVPGTMQSVALSGTGTTTASSTVLSLSPSVVSAGGSVTFKATVTASAGSPTTAPTGTVNFLNGGTTLGTASLDATGAALISVKSLGQGSYNNLTASYPGDSVYLASTSAAASLSVVSIAVSSTSLSVAAQTVLPGQPVALNVTVSGAGGPPTGSVTVYDGTTVIASGISLTAGSLAYSTAGLALGYHALSAVYGGSGAFTGSTSNTIGVLVSNAAYPVATLVPGIVSTLAGIYGTKGSSGDNGPASGALFNAPGHIAFDAAGNLYISDAANHTVREIVAGGGALTGASNLVVFAGSEGTPGSSGDGSAATSARLFGPQGIAFDQAGNLYIADSLNNVVRMVSASTGKISTFAGNKTAGYSGDGGLATSASLNAPVDVAVDLAGNVYIADAGNNVVRVVSAGNGKIATFAGNGRLTSSTFPLGDGGAANAASFNGIAGVAVDLNQNVYISDSGNQVVRLVSVGTGKIATVAGTAGSGGYTGDSGPAGAARLLSPGALSLNLAGDLFISDAGNSAVREVDTAGNIFTVAGTGMAGYSGDGGPATTAQLSVPSQAISDTFGNLYIADTAAATVRTVNGQSSSLAFAEQAAGGAGAPLSLRLIDSGGTPLSVSAATFTSSVFMQLAQGASDCSGTITLAAGADCTFAVVANSTGPGKFTGSLQITDNSLGNAAAQQSAALSVQTVSVPNQTITFVQPAAVTYGVAPVQLAASASSGLAVSFQVISGPGTLSGSTLTVTGAGSIVIQASQAGQPLVWAAAPSVTQTLVVNKAALTVTAGSFVQSGGTALQALTYSIAGFVNADTQATATTGQPALSTTATSSSPGGIYPVTVMQGTLAAANYSFTFVNGTLTISGSAQSISFGALAPVTYGAAPIALSATASSGLPVSFAVLSGPGNIVGSTLTITGAGNVVVQASQPGNADPVTFVGYGPAAPVQQTLIVAKAPLSIAVANASRVYGVANPAFASTISGAIGTDVLAASYSTTATATSPPATYPITATIAGANAASYLVTSTPGTLTITQATPQFLLSASTAQIVYGASVTLTASFVANLGLPPSGSVTFQVGSVAVGTAPLSNGVATLTTRTLPPGALTLTVAYNGDTNYLSGTSSALGVNVVSPTTVGLSVSPASSNIGDTVTLVSSVTATASGAGTPTGTIQFLNGSVSLGTVALSGGSAQLTVTSLPVGGNSITAQYSGASLFASSLSAAVIETVSQPFAITLPVTSVTIASGQTAQIQGSIAANNAFAKPIAITCTGLPQYATCGLSATSFTPNSATSSLPLNIQIATAGVRAAIWQHPTGSTIFQAAVGWSLLGFGPLALLLLRRKKMHGLTLAVILTLGSLAGVSGCGGSPNNVVSASPGTSTVSITGISGTTSISTTFTLVVQ